MSIGAGVLAGPLQHLRPLGRQRLQMDARALVAAVLGPHHREDAELGQVRLAAHERDDALVLVGLEPVAFDRGCDRSCSRDQRAGPQGLHHRFEDHQPVGAAEHRLARALRMRHQADDVARLVAQAGDCCRRSVRIRLVVDSAVRRRVAEHHLTVASRAAR